MRTGTFSARELKIIREMYSTHRVSDIALRLDRDPKRLKKNLYMFKKKGILEGDSYRTIMRKKREGRLHETAAKTGEEKA